MEKSIALLFVVVTLGVSIGFALIFLVLFGYSAVIIYVPKNADLIFIALLSLILSYLSYYSIDVQRAKNKMQSVVVNLSFISVLHLVIGLGTYVLLLKLTLMSIGFIEYRMRVEIDDLTSGLAVLLGLYLITSIYSLVLLREKDFIKQYPVVLSKKRF